MKANGSKRKIFDAVDMMTADVPKAETGNGLQSLPVDKIKPFHDHPFHLYQGERLDDMVESIREHGVLNPVIVRKKGNGYEMLSGHNRQNAAKLAGLTEIPAIVKEGLSDEEAYVYVIETNVIQRSFTDLAPSEKAAVLSARYEKVISQGRRNDILQEIEEIGTCGHDVHKSRSRDGIGEEYGISGYGKVQGIDGHRTEFQRLGLRYIMGEQIIVAEKDAAINEKAAKSIRAAAGELTDNKLEEILHPVRESAPAKAVSVRIPAEAEEKYFSGMKAKERTDLVMKALDAWFAGKETADV